MRHLEVRQKYSAACRIFNSLLGVSSGNETLRLMFDILLERQKQTKWIEMHQSQVNICFLRGPLR